MKTLIPRKRKKKELHLEHNSVFVHLTREKFVPSVMCSVRIGKPVDVAIRGVIGRFGRHLDRGWFKEAATVSNDLNKAHLNPTRKEYTTPFRLYRAERKRYARQLRRLIETEYFRLTLKG